MNALLDDLHQVYGANRRRGRGRTTRPVLIYDQRSLGRVGRYFIRLIEDERLRRALPDPLLLVQIRDRDGEQPLVEGEIVVARHENLPEFDGTDTLPPVIRRWLRERHLSGALGTRRTLTLPVAELPREWRERSWRSEPTWVMTRPVRAAAMSASGGAVVGVLVLAGLVVIPDQVQAFHPCIDEGVWVPQGITRAKDQEKEKGQDEEQEQDKNQDKDKDKDRNECYGVTFGDFVFDERLKEVTNKIKKQNDKVDESGKPYVTIAYIGELSTDNSKDPSRDDSEDPSRDDPEDPSRDDPEDPSQDDPDVSALAGVQGELLGMAYRQEKHNNPDRDHRPDVKILLGNVGEDWTYSVDTAREIVDMAGDENLDTQDRPIAVIGFGHSVLNNSRAIQEIGEASLAMVGTTATFNDVAQSRFHEYSDFFFPIAPSNSRMAAQAARWARQGVPWSKSEEEKFDLRQSDTAVAIGNAETDEDGDTHEQYGPHLAREFMNAFVKEEAGTAWTSKRGLDTDEQIDEAVLLYQDEEIFPAYLERLCLADEPPDLIYFAGRSDDFSEFYEALQSSEGDKCSGGGVTILGGDDISKTLSDKEEEIEDSSHIHPVYYTPLAPSGRWGERSRDQGFYPAMEKLVCELYGQGPERDCLKEESRRLNLPNSNELPSIAHAAIGNDALFAITDALSVIGSTKEQSGNEQCDPDQASSPRTDDDYEEKRDELHCQIKTSGFTGVSGYIAFDADNDGNWLGDRMVQLVLVGPALPDDTDDVQRQHVLQRCGLSSAGSVEKEEDGEPGEECLEVGVETDEDP